MSSLDISQDDVEKFGQLIKPIKKLMLKDSFNIEGIIDFLAERSMLQRFAIVKQFPVNIYFLNQQKTIVLNCAFFKTDDISPLGIFAHT